MRKEVPIDEQLALMPFRITESEFAAGMQEAQGQFEVFSDAVASRDSQLPQADLVAALRDNAENPWSPPGGGQAGALSHDIIHGLDITWPLGIDHQADVEGRQQGQARARASVFHAAP